MMTRPRNDDWTGQMPIVGVGSASSPTAAMLKGGTYLAWRGPPGEASTHPALAARLPPRSLETATVERYPERLYQRPVASQLASQ